LQLALAASISRRKIPLSSAARWQQPMQLGCQRAALLHGILRREISAAKAVATTKIKLK